MPFPNYNKRFFRQSLIVPQVRAIRDWIFEIGEQEFTRDSFPVHPNRKSLIAFYCQRPFLLVALEQAAPFRLGPPLLVDVLLL